MLSSFQIVRYEATLAILRYCLVGLVIFMLHRIIDVNQSSRPRVLQSCDERCGQEVKLHVRWSHRLSRGPRFACADLPLLYHHGEMLLQ